MKTTTRHLVLALVATLGLAGFSAGRAAEPVVQDLRGKAVNASDDSAENYRAPKDGPPVPRSFVQQPPVIPHAIDSYQISKNFNKCMDCHAWNRYREAGATKVSLTHFKDREGQELSNISPRRYFCTQCHVPQTDAKPLVSNSFKPAEGLR
jgi:cytochrome c-type protein NapB